MAKRTLTDSWIRRFDNPEHRPAKRIEIYDELREGLALRVSPSGHRSFVYRYRIHNKVKRFTIGSYPAVGLVEARRRAEDLHLKVKRGIDPQVEKRTRRRTPEPKTVTELAEYFKKRHLPTLRPSSQENYRRIIDHELIPTFGEQYVNHLEPIDIIDFLDEVALDRGSPVMSNRIRAVFSSMYSFGMKRA